MILASVYAGVKRILNFRCCFYSFSYSLDFHEKTVSLVSVPSMRFDTQNDTEVIPLSQVPRPIFGTDTVIPFLVKSESIGETEETVACVSNSLEPRINTVYYRYL